MTGASRVAWREGLFLRPHHFQQQDRYFDAQLAARIASLASHPWGVIELKISDSAAQRGKFAIERLVAVLPDGSTISIPGAQPAPDPIDLGPDVRDRVVSITLPEHKPGSTEFLPAAAGERQARYLITEEEVHDAAAAHRPPERLELAAFNLRLGSTREETDGRVTLPLARVTEVVNGKVVFDPTFIPPTLDAHGSPRLVGFINDIVGRADQQAAELAQRAADPDAVRGKENSNFLLLQTLGRWTPVLNHLGGLPNLHPERLYETFVSMAGDLACLTLKDRQAPRFAVYDHANLRDCFEPVYKLLQIELSGTIAVDAGQLRLEAVGPNAFTALIDDNNRFGGSNIYIAVSARVRPEELMAIFPKVVRVGAVTRMREIVQNALLGVAVSPSPLPPYQIRPLPGYVYFELDRSSAHWRELAKAPSMGLQLPGEWPELKIEVWWVLRAS